MHCDAEINFTAQLGSTPFVCHYLNHRDGDGMAEYAQLVLDGHGEAGPVHVGDHRVVFMVTAGRNGLSREFVQWVKSLRNVDRVLYSSCNRKVTQREMQWFLEGEDGESERVRVRMSEMFCVQFQVLCVSSWTRSSCLLPLSMTASRDYFVWLPPNTRLCARRLLHAPNAPFHGVQFIFRVFQEEDGGKPHFAAPRLLPDRWLCVHYIALHSLQGREPRVLGQWLAVQHSV